MDVILNNLRGIDDAMVSIFMSKNHINIDKEIDIRKKCADSININGFLKPSIERQEEFNYLWDKVVSIGVRHTTILRFIDFSFTVYGLHRGAQDDLDAHAERFHTRVIRQSTRLCTDSGIQKSAYYENKILTMADVMSMLGVELPDEITDKKGNEYIRTENGYVNKNYIRQYPMEQQDVIRGLYPLSMASNCIVKCDLYQFAHVYKMRRPNCGAHRELSELMELLITQLAYALDINRDDLVNMLVNRIQN